MERTIIDIEKIANEYLKTKWIVNTKTFDLLALGWKFEFNNRKTALGLCLPSYRIISLSKYLFNLAPGSIDWDDIIKHEISHAIDFEIRGLSDHSLTWKNIAKQIGCIPETYYIGSGSKKKYSLICTNCSTIISRHRKCKDEIACFKCCKEYNNGKFSEKYRLEVAEN